MSDRRFILASSSPRRKALLEIIHIYPEIIPPSFPEIRKKGEDIYHFLQRVSIGKGRSILTKERKQAIVISADTIVVIDDLILGKPESREDAFRILSMLSGRVHTVISGVAIHYQDRCSYGYRETEVFFDKLKDSDIHHYLDYAHYMDKAGAYGIQGLASKFIRKIDGCYFNVMGFPINLFSQMLNKIILECETDIRID